MTLHVFNPEHDLSLASGLKNFTAPHAGRQLRYDLGWIPALWVNGDDHVVMAEYVPTAPPKGILWNCMFTDRKGMHPADIDRVEPWGWDAAVRAQLLHLGISQEALPTEDEVDEIRQLSHRHTASWLLPQLRIDGTVGEAMECTSADEALALARQWDKAVLKAPWSSSGRGVRFLSAPNTQSTLPQWLSNTVARQGSVMAEPFYHKVRDFGMEFVSDGCGTVSYLGLSLFHTQNGAYTGNIIATEEAKRQMLGRFLAPSLLDSVKEMVCEKLGDKFNGRYKGPFGIDMMVVKEGDSTLLHPCVELNLRRTMGHVALAIGGRLNPTADDEVRHVMRIDYSNNNYKLQIKRL